jgi:hypothetical protein
MVINKEIFDDVCLELETSAKGIYKICRERHLDTTEFYKYMRITGESATLRYARAKELQCDNMADDMQDIADNCEDSNKGRLQVDTRKWYLSKIKPKRYGDHQVIEIQSELKSITEDMIKIVKEFVPADLQSAALAKLQMIGDKSV